MWGKKGKLIAGFLVGGGWILTGFLLQVAVGPVRWESCAYPVSVILLVSFILLLVIAHTFWRKASAASWLYSYQAAVPAIAWVIVAMLVMGVTKQMPYGEDERALWGISNMLSFWPFVLLYAWMTVILGLVTLSHLFPFKLKNIPFLLNHLGLFLVLIGATLGSADIRKLTMNVRVDFPEWQAMDEAGRMYELPLTITLKKFTIDEYPPKLVLVSNKEGQGFSRKPSVSLSLDNRVKKGKLLHWTVSVKKVLPMATKTSSSNDDSYLESSSKGATSAVQVVVVDSIHHVTKEGWVSCGNYLFPDKVLPLDSLYSLAMPTREPKRFSSEVEIKTPSGNKLEAEIEVNKPYKIGLWNIYQYGYDEELGRWSDVSVLQLVKDPWLPVVYVGIGMMIAGALCLFACPKKRKESHS